MHFWKIKSFYHDLHDSPPHYIGLQTYPITIVLNESIFGQWCTVLTLDVESISIGHKSAGYGNHYGHSHGYVICRELGQAKIHGCLKSMSPSLTCNTLALECTSTPRLHRSLFTDGDQSKSVNSVHSKSATIIQNTGNSSNSDNSDTSEWSRLSEISENMSVKSEISEFLGFWTCMKSAFGPLPIDNDSSP